MIVLDWGDGKYAFALKLKQIDELERLCDCGIGELVSRIFEQRFKGRDVYHTIRLGLIGGGMAPVVATKLCDTYVDGVAFFPPGDPSGPGATATAVMMDCWIGVKPQKDGDEPKKDPAAANGSTSRPSEPASSEATPAPPPAMT